MKKRFFYIVFALVLAIYHSSALFAMEINFKFQRPENAPYFIGVPELNIESDEFDTLKLNIRSATDTAARLFWASSLDPKMDQQKSIQFNIARSENGRDYCFTVPDQNPNWIGYIPQILIYPENNIGGITIQSGKALHGDLSSKIFSGWQEFWGPRGRSVIGSTINVIPASNLFGTPINVYFYWLIAIFFGCSFAYFAYRPKPLKKKTPKIEPLNSALKAALAFSLGLWIALALNSDLNYFNIFKSNLKYAGHTLAEKREIAYGSDYYAFLDFAKQKLPPQPVKFAVLSSRYAPDLQARIFLVPHILSDLENKETNYILVFQPDPGQKIKANNLPIYAKLNENAYIVKKAIQK